MQFCLNVESFYILFSFGYPITGASIYRSIVISITDSSITICGSSDGDGSVVVGGDAILEIFLSSIVIFP